MKLNYRKVKASAQRLLPTKWRSQRLFALLAIALPICAVPRACGTAVTWTTNYYPVGGTTVREIYRSLRYNRPWKTTSDHDGSTAWRVDWTFSVNESGNKCRLGSISTRTTIAVTLPRWTGPTNATAEVRRAWQRYITALRQHEAGHGQFALAAAAEIQKRAREFGEDANCPALRQKINSLCQTIVEQHRAREKEYDERTKHGVTQGAVLSREPEGDSQQ